jgi:hypothetical protein
MRFDIAYNISRVVLNILVANDSARYRDTGKFRVAITDYGYLEVVIGSLSLINIWIEILNKTKTAEFSIPFGFDK